MRGAVAVAILLSGCLSGSAPGSVAPSPDTAPTLLPPYTWQAHGCDSLLLVLLPERPVVVPRLPPGFAPADADTFLGTDVATGRALVLVGFISCPEGSVRDRPAYAHASVSILVQAPSGHPAAADVYDFYDVSHTAQLWLRIEMLRRGWDVEDAPIFLEPPDVRVPLADPGAWQASYREENATGEVQVFGAPEYAVALSAVRFWRVSEDILHEMRLEYDQVARVGPASCRFDPDSAPGELLGLEDVRPPLPNCPFTEAPPVGAVLSPFDFTITLASHEVPF